MQNYCPYPIVNLLKWIGVLGLLGIAAPIAYTQTACDTLVTKDGRTILVEITLKNINGYFYTKCNEVTQIEFFIALSKVVELRTPSGVIRPKTVSKSLARPILRNIVPMRKETDLRRPKTIIWAGLLPVGVFAINSNPIGIGFIQLGAEMGIKNSPVRLGAVLRPFYVISNANRGSYKKNGTTAEVGIFIKKMPYGRLSSHVGSYYLGMDVNLGREAYLHTTNATPNQQTNKFVRNWFSLMPRFGYQVYHKMLAFDFALSFGYQWYQHTGLNHSIDKNRTFAVQPSISIGYKF